MIKRLFKNEKGVAAVEFAMVAPVYFALLLGTMDQGYQAYFRNLLQGVMDAAAREAATGNLTASEVDTFIKDRVKNLLPASQRNNPAAFVIDKKAFYNFSNVNQPEKITSDTLPLGSFNAGDCYEDSNGNSQYDTSAGSTGVGSADDIVFYTVTARFPRLVPLPTSMGLGPNNKIKVTTIIRNQPFSQQNAPRVRCS